MNKHFRSLLNLPPQPTDQNKRGRNEADELELEPSSEVEDSDTSDHEHLSIPTNLRETTNDALEYITPKDTPIASRTRNHKKQRVKPIWQKLMQGIKRIGAIYYKEAIAKNTNYVEKSKFIKAQEKELQNLTDAGVYDPLIKLSKSKVEPSKIIPISTIFSEGSTLDLDNFISGSYTPASVKFWSSFS
ncbi:hypothetical protein DAKH74_024090 [Maudiozyma humilis]|uniref:Uncharacterized protein n=1 Tax=Maudiozyma humilis TaxID=51915 RepID=A0AAV5RX06_MAUHU|nr:hypothetical protein DAKH74_024090 [Kazachstania humilis]